MTHSTTVGRVLNLATGYISLQFHVVYDELFTSVQGQVVEEAFDEETWSRMLTLGGHDHAFDDTNDRGRVIPFHEYYDDFVGSEGADEDFYPMPTCPELDPLLVPEGDVEDRSPTDATSREHQDHLSRR